MNEGVVHDKSEPTPAPFVCVECETAFDAATNLQQTNAGVVVCPDCVAAYYIACGDCTGFVPQDETQERAGLTLCAACYAKPAGVAGATAAAAASAPDESGIESLVAEYAALHAEEKRIGARLDEIKEQLKNVAATQPRVLNGVTLRAGDAAVKCSFRTTLKCDAEAVERLVATLDQNEFGELFERKVSYSPHKDHVQEFLQTTDGEREAARELLRAAVRETETATLTVVPARKS